MPAFIAQAFRGVDPTTPLDVSPVSLASGTSGTPNPPSITTSKANSLVIALGALQNDNVTPTAPTGYTNTVFYSDWGTVMMASKIVATAGVEDPAAFSGGNDLWRAGTIALRAALPAGALFMGAGI